MITSKELSFVVQGPVHTGGEFSTINACNSIRKYFPDAEIILSTWIGENTEGITYDTLVLSEDPGGFLRWDKVMVNVNRQIVSSYNGIKATGRPYVVKTRTDILFNNDQLLAKFNNHEIAKLFSKKITTINVFSRDPVKWALEIGRAHV